MEFESTEPAETVIPGQTVRAFAEGLSQLIKKPLERVKVRLNKLGRVPSSVVESYLPDMQSSVDETRTLLEALRIAGDVRVIPIDSSSYDLAISRGIEVAERPRPGTIIMSDAQPFIRGLMPKLSTPIAALVGASRALEMKSETKGKTQDGAKIIRRTSLRILHLLSELVGAEQIEIITNTEGQTTLKPLPLVRP